MFYCELKCVLHPAVTGQWAAEQQPVTPLKVASTIEAETSEVLQKLTTEF